MTSTSLVVVRGADAVGYVDSQCTQDLGDLAVGSTLTTLVLDPRGTLVALALVAHAAPDEVSLEVPADTAPALLARLERFAIRTDATFDLVAGPPRAWYGDELGRITSGIPGTAELARDLVAHALEDPVRSACVSFTKGCYPGQELVARMQSRGATPPYVLRRCLLDVDAAAGTPVGSEDKEGAITSVALDAESNRRWAMCVLHRTEASSAQPVRSDPAGVALIAGESSLRFGRADTT